MSGEVRIQIDVDAAGQYRFRMRSGTRELTSAVSADLTTSFYEDLRFLRWKSVGVRDPGDVLLNQVGDRLAALIASPERWQELGLRNEVRPVRIQFSQAAHRLMPFPWELLRINNQFLIGAHGSHLVRPRSARACWQEPKTQSPHQRRAHQPGHRQRAPVRRGMLHAPRNGSRKHPH